MIRFPFIYTFICSDSTRTNTKVSFIRRRMAAQTPGNVTRNIKLKYNTTLRAVFIREKTPGSSIKESDLSHDSCSSWIHTTCSVI